MKNQKKNTTTYLLVMVAVVVVVALFVLLAWLFLSLPNAYNNKSPGVAAPSLNASNGKMPEGGDKTVKPVARINGEVITNYDLLTRQRIYFLENNVAENVKLLGESRDAVLKMLIIEKLQEQFSNQSGIPSFLSEASQQLDQVAQQNKKTREEMVQMLATRGIAEQQITRYIANTIRWQSVVYGFVNQSSIVTPVDVNEKINSKKQLMGRNIYQALQIDIKNPDDAFVQQVKGALQKNPGGWQNDLASELNKGRMTVIERRDWTAKQFGEPFASQLLQQKSSVTPGLILGPKYSNNNKTATLYLLMAGGVMPNMPLDQLKQNIAGEIKSRALQPIDKQIKERLWREAVIEFF